MSAIIIESGLVHYEALGRGRPLIFLHGWLGSWRYWMPTMENLSDRYRTYAFDLWGFGDSDRNANRYQVEAYVAQLDQFMEQLGIMRACLIGHALGAAVAMLAGALWPDRIERVMAVSTPLSAGLLNKRLTQPGNSSLIDRVLGRRAVGQYPEVDLEVGKTDPVAVVNSARSLVNIDLRQVFDQVKSPLLMVYGEKDPFISPLPSEEVSRFDTNIRPIGLAESGHFPMLDEASKFQRLLRDYLEARPADLGALALKEEWRRRMH
ncbi:MAG TPA: alpha/beta hydrolase [Anaerolineae bacterium]|nr:alpha/beta hydrolase [Anaerolineae bacterium]